VGGSSQGRHGEEEHLAKVSLEVFFTSARILEAITQNQQKKVFARDVSTLFPEAAR
jgi:hypothetical protein